MFDLRIPQFPQELLLLNFFFNYLLFSIIKMINKINNLVVVVLVGTVEFLSQTACLFSLRRKEYV